MLLVKHYLKKEAMWSLRSIWRKWINELIGGCWREYAQELMRNAVNEFEGMLHEDGIQALLFDILCISKEAKLTCRVAIRMIVAVLNEQNQSCRRYLQKWILRETRQVLLTELVQIFLEKKTVDSTMEAFVEYSKAMEDERWSFVFENYVLVLFEAILASSEMKSKGLLTTFKKVCKRSSPIALKWLVEQSSRTRSVSNRVFAIAALAYFSTNFESNFLVLLSEREYRIRRQAAKSLATNLICRLDDALRIVNGFCESIGNSNETFEGFALTLFYMMRRAEKTECLNKFCLFLNKLMHNIYVLMKKFEKDAHIQLLMYSLAVGLMSDKKGKGRILQETFNVFTKFAIKCRNSGKERIAFSCVLMLAKVVGIDVGIQWMADSVLHEGFVHFIDFHRNSDGNGQREKQTILRIIKGKGSAEHSKVDDLKEFILHLADKQKFRLSADAEDLFEFEFDDINKNKYEFENVFNLHNSLPLKAQQPIKIDGDNFHDDDIDRVVNELLEKNRFEFEECVSKDIAKLRELQSEVKHSKQRKLIPGINIITKKRTRTNHKLHLEEFELENKSLSDESTEKMQSTLKPEKLKLTTKFVPIEPRKSERQQTEKLFAPIDTPIRLAGIEKVTIMESYRKEDMFKPIPAVTNVGFTLPDIPTASNKPIKHDPTTKQKTQKMTAPIDTPFQSNKEKWNFFQGFSNAGVQTTEQADHFEKTFEFEKTMPFEAKVETIPQKNDKTRFNFSFNESNVERTTDVAISKRQTQDISMSAEFLTAIGNGRLAIGGKLNSLLKSLLKSVKLASDLHPLLVKVFSMDLILFLRIIRSWIDGKRAVNKNFYKTLNENDIQELTQTLNPLSFLFYNFEKRMNQSLSESQAMILLSDQLSLHGLSFTAGRSIKNATF